MMYQGQHGEYSINFKEIDLNKILTSHVGSLPRSQEVVDFIFARENNTKYDEKSFDECMQRSVLSTVEKQKNLELTLLVMVKPRKFHMLLMSKIGTPDFREIVQETRQQI